MKLRDSIRIVHFGRGQEVDLAYIMPLLRVAFREAAGQAASLPPQYEGQLRESLVQQQNVRVAVAVVRDKPVGLAICFIHPEPAIGGRTFELQDLVVLPAWRGRGVGSRLLSEVEAMAAREVCKKIILSVTVDNSVAQRLARHLGFSHCQPPRYFMEKEVGSAVG